MRCANAAKHIGLIEIFLEPRAIYAAHEIQAVQIEAEHRIAERHDDQERGPIFAQPGDRQAFRWFARVGQDQRDSKTCTIHSTSARIAGSNIDQVQNSVRYWLTSFIRVRATQGMEEEPARRRSAHCPESGATQPAKNTSAESPRKSRKWIKLSVKPSVHRCHPRLLTLSG